MEILELNEQKKDPKLCIIDKCESLKYKGEYKCVDCLIPDLNNQVKLWKEAWWSQREVTGSSYWKGYYQGVSDDQNNNVYDLEFGQTNYNKEIK